MRIITAPDLSVVVRVQASGEPLVLVPTGPRHRVLHLARAVLDAAEFEILRTGLAPAQPVVHSQRRR